MDMLFLHWWSKGENLSSGLRIRSTSVQEMLKSMHRRPIVHERHEICNSWQQRCDWLVRVVVVTNFCWQENKHRLFTHLFLAIWWNRVLVTCSDGNVACSLFPCVFFRRRNNVPDKSLCQRCARLYFWIIHCTVSSSVWQAWPLLLHTTSPGLNRANWLDWHCLEWRLSTSTSSTTESSTSFACVKESRLTTTPAQS